MKSVLDFTNNGIHEQWKNRTVGLREKANRLFLWENPDLWSGFSTFEESRGYRYLGLLYTQEQCQGFAVDYYSFTLDALDLRHPRLLQR